MPYAPRVYRITTAEGRVFFEPDPGKVAEHAASKALVEKCLRADVDALPADKKAAAEVEWAKIPKTEEQKRKDAEPKGDAPPKAKG